MTSSTLFRLDGKTAAIIGGGSGIGEAVAIGAAQHGARVVVLDANAGAAVRVAASIGGGATAGTLDIRDGAAVHEALDSIHGYLGGTISGGGASGSRLRRFAAGKFGGTAHIGRDFPHQIVRR